MYDEIVILIIGWRISCGYFCFFVFTCLSRCSLFSRSPSGTLKGAIITIFFMLGLSCAISQGQRSVVRGLGKLCKCVFVSVLICLCAPACLCVCMLACVCICESVLENYIFTFIFTDVSIRVRFFWNVVMHHEQFDKGQAHFPSSTFFSWSDYVYDSTVHPFTMYFGATMQVMEIQFTHLVQCSFYLCFIFIVSISH